MTNDIRRVAVLGAGTMGAAIAAHAANAGLAVDLLDLDREAVKGGFERMLAARPAALASPRLADRIRLGTFEEDFERLADADWVVEAVVERLEPKQELLARVEKTVGPEAVVSSNTSGLPLHSVAEGRSDDFRRRFLGTHFFNPPRYLKLVELIGTADTDPEVLEGMRAFVERVLGKGAVVARDTPNFIANRLGSFASMHDIRYALEHGYSIEEVDALTGPLVGRPKTATFRLFDQVGLDVMVGVAGNLYELAPGDEERDVLPAPEPLKRMLEARRLGNKTGGGFYRRGRRDGQTVFDVLDLETLEYRPAARPDLPIVAAARDRDDLGARLRFLLDKADEDRGARYLRDTLLPSLAYAARRVPEIADSLVEVDHAVEWGFGYELGPFRAWDAIGVADGVSRMEALGIEVPAWVTEMLAAGHQAFYRDGQVYSPLTRDYVPVPADPEVIDLDRLKEGGAEVAGNASASLVDLSDGVLCFELHAPASAIDAAVVELGARALEELESGRWAGMVIANQARNFCVGANLGEVGMAAYQGQHDQVVAAVEGLQQVLMGFRHAPRPVVAAPHGQTLGGGAEIVLHADRVVAALETYIGLVEVGVGIVPAGGGCKELLRRVVAPAVRAAPDAPALPFVQRVFETIGLAKVATSAVEAQELGFLEEHDVIVLNAEHQLAAARREVLDLADAYRPPAREASIYAAGLPVLAALELGVQTLQWAGQASDHDGVVARHLARVLCGGELSLGQWVTEQHILDLERDAFLALLREPRTMERIQGFLMTGKVIRN
ncbi:MAG TPA: 3-hydroxyacyl-CoA dehydrogenase/enoyl-CoA hydratase family protein [Actinomycetes bacterium]|nr:3-hydroxyacyl-CoA dehydrogenase/enoyl-CoA hydratase family protein [Actinomycetes bacterium]